MTKRFSREIKFEGVLNFRDLGGYRAQDGRTIAWRHVFRSGELPNMTERDAIKLKEELKIVTVIDLRSSDRQEKTGAGLLSQTGIKIISVPCNMVTDVDIKTRKTETESHSSLEEALNYRMSLRNYSQSLIEALDIIADRENHPVVFHCNAGKERSGMLAALLLSVLGVIEKDIIDDYVLTDQYMKAFIARWNSDTETGDILDLPAYQLRATPESMVVFLKALKKDFGSAEGYLKNYGADKMLVKRLENVLLV
jgi:protein-tyrosine phosphatase